MLNFLSRFIFFSTFADLEPASRSGTKICEAPHVFTLLEGKRSSGISEVSSTDLFKLDRGASVVVAVGSAASGGAREHETGNGISKKSLIHS